MIHLQPDAELIVSDYLRSRPEVTDLLVQYGSTVNAVWTVIPKSATWPLVVVGQIDDQRVTDVDWLTRTLVQTDVYGGTKRQAERLAKTVRAVMEEMPAAAIAEGICTAVKFRSGRPEPDPRFPDARPRYRQDFELWLHPDPVAPGS